MNQTLTQETLNQEKGEIATLPSVTRNDNIVGLMNQTPTGRHVLFLALPTSYSHLPLQQYQGQPLSRGRGISCISLWLCSSGFLSFAQN